MKIYYVGIIQLPSIHREYACRHEHATGRAAEACARKVSNSGLDFLLRLGFAPEEVDEMQDSMVRVSVKEIVQLSEAEAASLLDATVAEGS